MHITAVSVKNFRCIEEMAFSLHRCTALIGENNAGKTTVLEAIKLVLGRRWGRSGATGFNEFDFRVVHDEEGGRTYPPIEIELTFEEQVASEWPQPIQDELVSIINLNPHTNRSWIKLRATCVFESLRKEVEPEWRFLNESDEPFAGSGGRNQNLSNFFQYVPFYSMAALRDTAVEFGPRSRLWTSLLRNVDFPPDVASRLELQFSELNAEVLTAEPRLDRIKDSIKGIADVVATGAASDVDLRAIPTNLWEVLSRSELIVQGRENDPWLPIGRHGQGVQSLAVIFLFRAFVASVLTDLHRPESEPILALEEPESHLHPQASRALWQAVNDLPGQKILTTHSPYFAQRVPFENFVLIRRTDNGSKAFSIARAAEVTVTPAPNLPALVGGMQGVSYNQDTGLLKAERELTRNEFQAFLQCYPADRSNDRRLRSLFETSKRLMTGDDLRRLESFAKRIRGEIFFARKWILCEGQSDFALLSAVGEIMGCSPDVRGVALIDYQNNGNPGIFVALARAFDIPWSMLCDGDDEGSRHIAQVRQRHFSAEEIAARVEQLPTGVDLEALVVASALRPLMLAAIHKLNDQVPDVEGDMLAFARAHKEEVAVRIAALMRQNPSPADIPAPLKAVFQRAGELAVE